MAWTRLPRSLVIVPALALPASAQGPPTLAGAPPDGLVVAAPGPPPARTGWRRRHAERKRHLQEAALGFPEEFNEWPLGRSLYAHGRTEVANAAAAGLILNHCDFIADTAELNDRGRDRLAAIAARLPASFDPVIIERTPWAPGVAESRRLAIAGQLARGPFPVPAERVVIAPAISRGLTGGEAIVVDGLRLNASLNGGASISSGGLSSPLGGAAPLRAPR